MDRIDIHLDVRRLPPAQVLARERGTPSAVLRDEVLAGRAFASWRRVRAAEAAVGEGPADGAAMTAEARTLLVSLAELHAMSGRAMMRSLAVARTIADMAESEEVAADHVAEAVSYRIREGVGGC